jgi:hypothetical protein
MDDLIAFINARLDEDEAAVKRYGLGERSQRSVNSKRAIVAMYEHETEPAENEPEWEVQQLIDARIEVLLNVLAEIAAVWSDHPDYRADGAPGS